MPKSKLLLHALEHIDGERMLLFHSVHMSGEPAEVPLPAECTNAYHIDGGDHAVLPLWCIKVTTGHQRRGCVLMCHAGQSKGIAPATMP